MADYIYGQPDAADESNPYGKPAPKPSGALRKAVGDKVVGFASGAVGATKAIADAVGAGNVVSNTLDNANKGVNDYLSPEAKADQQAHSARSEQAKGTGAWNEFKAGVQNFAESPIQQTVTGVGSIVPVALAALGGLPAAAATGIAMGAGTVKGRIYDDTKKRGIDAGLSAADADAAATKAQNYTGENADQIALGGALGAADALTGAGRVAGGMLRNAVMKPAISAIPKAVERGIVGRAAMGALGEVPLEAAQGGQEQLATNIAAQRQGVNVDTWSGVAGQATEEGLASLGSGAAFGVARGRNASTPPPGAVPPPAVPPAPPLQIGNTPDPYISFPDGTVARRSEADAYVNSLPADQQPAARAKLMGLAPQPAKPSEQMGLTPTAGPSLTNAAITAVDSGAAQVNIDQAPAEQTDIVEQQRQQYQQETAALLAQQDQEAFDAYLAAIEDANTALDEAPGESVQALSQLDDISVPDIFDANSNTSDADFLRAMGATEQEIADAITNQPGSPQAGTPNPVGTAQDEPGSTGQGVSADQTKQANLERIRKANNVSQPDGVQPLPATSSGQDGNQPAASVGLGTVDGNELGANAAGSESGAVGQSGEQASGALRTPVAQGRQQPTTLGTQTSANAGPGFSAKDVQGVKNQSPAATDPQAGQAPVEAPQAVAGDAAPASGVPAAGSAAVEGDGVEPKAKWLKAINDQNRLAGDTGVQLKVVDGKLTFYGDPKSTKQGRALEATLAEARKAGATQQEIIGSISQPAATNPAAGVGPASLGSVKADMDNLFGIDQKRAKALDRIAAGKAWFANGIKAQQFIATNGLKDTHKAVKTSATRFDVVAKDSQPTKSTNEKATEAVKAKSQQQEASAAPESVSNQGDGLNDHIRSLRSKAHEGIKQGGPRGDVRLNVQGKNLYVTFDVAVAEAKLAVANGMRPVPFQVSNTLDIGIGETDRVIAALSAPVQKPVTPQIVPAKPTNLKEGDEGLVVTQGKGLIKGKFLSSADGSGTPGGPWETESEALNAAKDWREKRKQDAATMAADLDRKNSYATKLRDGHTPTSQEVEGLGLRAAGSELTYFIPRAAELFGITSRQVRPLIADLIRVGTTDMGSKIESVNPIKALAQIAKTQSTQDASAANRAKLKAKNTPNSQDSQDSQDSLDNTKVSQPPKETNGTQAAQTVQATQEGSQPPAAAVEPISNYALPKDSKVHEDWRKGESNGFQPDARQQLVMDATKKALDDGLFYTNEVVARVASILNVPKDILDQNKSKVEGGDFGYDVYMARKAVESKAAFDSARKTAEEMQLKPGDSIGVIVTQDGKKNTSVVVESVGESGLSVTITGKRGIATVKGKMGVDALKNAIENAHKKGVRKAGYAEFLKGRDAASSKKIEGAISNSILPKAPQSPAEPAPVATESVAKPDAKAVLSEREKAAKAKMFNALGKLATLAGKNTRMNWTQEEEQQLLPIVIELFDGAMELGAVTFQQAVAYVREFISTNLDQETADSIPFDTLQGAYISVAGRHKDKPVTSKKEVVSFESLAELENSTDKADTETKDTENDSGTEKQGSGALDGVSPGKVGGTGSRGSGGRGTKSGSTSRRKGNSSTDGKRGTPGRSGGNGTSDADSSSTGGAGGRRGIESDGGRVPANGGSPDVELASGSGRGVPKGQDGLFTESGEVIPAAVPAANFTITPDLKLGSGGEVTKYKDNIAAIRALKLIESEHRRATSEEQRVLARYVGWGGLANAFRNRVTGAVKADWANEVAELESLLTAKELKAASASTPNAHYTSETVTSFMWRAAVRLGYSGGMALESSVGSGNFIGLMPENARRDTYLTGIELDSITARIAGALYPQSNIVHSAFEKVALPDNTFDLNIGNPPFGNISLRMQYNPKHNGKSIHNQFFLGGMDALKPGGLQTMVVSRYLMDAQDASTREALALKAELLGAIRLPGSAFKGNAGTDVVTDILFLKKRSTAEQAELQDLWNSRSAKVPAKESYADRADRLAGQARLAQVLDWTTTAKVPDPLGGEAMQISKYFADNPKMVAGVMDRSGSMQFGGDIDVKLPASELAAKLDSLIAFLPEIKGESRSDEVNAKTEEMHRALGESMSIMASGREIGSIYYDESGALTEIVERVGVDGKTIVSKNTIDASTPWSSQLSMNMEGKWFKEVAQLDENGEKVKVGRKLNPKTGRLTVGRNVWVREVFANESDVPSGLRLGEEGFAKLKKLVGIRELYVEQINLETNSAQTEPMEANRTKLRAAYEAFVADHGYISEQKNAAIISEMPDEGLMLSLELKFRPAVTLSAAVKRGIKPSAARAEQNAILTRAVAIPPERKNNASSVSDAVAIVLGESGRIDVARVAELRGVTEDDALAELTGGDSPLAYMDPETNEVTEKNQYLSGNVRKKMVAARDAGLKRNVDALMKVQPEPWTSDKVTAHMGASWIPPEVYANFVKSLLGRDATVTFSQLSNTFEVSAPGSTAIDTSKWGTGRLPAVELLNDVLNSRRIAIYDGGGKDSPRVLNETETQSAIDKKKEIIEEFDNWIFKDGDRRQELTGLFNDKYNILVNRQYDGSHMEFPGKVPDSIIAFRRNQINAIWRGIVDRFTMYDHAVGAGKTFTGIARAMERKRMGLSNKPTIVVPNHLVSEWATQAYRLYPGAKILAAGAKDLEPKNRRRLFAKIAAGDWDLVIVPHSSFKFIGISPETEERFINDELRVAQDALKEAEDDAEPGQRFKPLSVKAAEAMILKLENRMDVVRGKAGKDQLLTFEQMGIDDLTVDEAHEFKNLTYITKLTDVRGLGPAAGSQKAFDLYTKMRILHETNGSAVFLTGTPISNSAVEMYTIMRYLAPDVLRESGLEHFDAFRAQYVQATEKPEPTEAGDGLKVVNRLGRNWSNMRSLMDGYYSVADVVTNDDIKAWFAEDNPGKVFPLPNVKGGGRRSVVAKPTPTQQLLIDELIAGYNGLPNIEDVRERNIARLRLMDKARKLALHAKVWDRTLTDEPGGKLDKVVDESFRLYKAFAAEKGTQLIFLDRSVPKAQGDDKQIKDYDSLRAKLTEANANGDENGQREAIEALEKFDPQEIDELRAAQAGGWNAYQHMADGLIAKGVPKEQIAFIQNFTTDAQKKALFEAVNDGSIRFLFGSSQRMGAGMNVQERLVGLHHVDVTWKPSDIEQREGRIIRQGNLFFTPPTADNPNPLYRADFEVEIMAYVTERSIDAKMWDLNSTKLRMVNGIRYYDGEFEMDFDDDAAIDMAEIAAIASGDPLMLERIKVNTIIEELYRKRRSYNRRVESAGDSLRRAEHDVETLPGEIAKKKALMAPIDDAFQKASSDQYSRRVMVGDKEFRSLEQALKHAEETILIAKEGDSKRQFALDIDGESFKSEAGVQDAITEKMGDISSFVAEIDGKKVIRRTAVARELRRLIGSEFTDIATTNVGSLFGFPFSMKTEKTRYGSFVDLSVKVPYEGGVETIAIAYDLTPEKHTKGTTVTVLTSTLRAALERLVDKMDSIRTDVYGIEYMQRNLKEATENIPTYREAVKEQFKQADELDAALTRLDDIQDQLQARAAAAAVTPVAPVADDDAAAFSRPTFSRGAQSQANESVERLANGIASHWENAPKIVVAFDMNDPIIPDNVRKEDMRQRSGGATGTPEGFYYKGTVYLMSSKLGTPDDIARVLFHEALGHYGLRGLFGKALKPVLNEISMRRRAEVDAKIKQYGLKMGSKLDRMTAAEEVLAELAQSRPDIGIVQRAIAAIRTWLRENVPGLSKLSMTDAEIIRSYILPARAWVENSANGSLGGRIEPTFSRGGAASIRGGDADPAEAAKVQAGIEGKSLIDAARFIQDTGTPAQAEIAGKVIEKLSQIQAGGANLRLIVAHSGDQVPSEMIGARGYTQAAMDEKGYDVTVWIHGSDMTDFVGMEYETVLHELVHAATAGAILYGKYNPGTEIGKSYADLDRVSIAVENHINQRFSDASDGKIELTEFEKDMRAGANNAFRSLDEFVSWALTSRDAQDYLESIPYKSASVWTAFVQAIRKSLGLNQSADTALSEMLRVSESLLSSEFVKDRGMTAFWHKRGIKMSTTQAKNSIILKPNNSYKPENLGHPNIRFSRSIGDTLTSAANSARDVNLPAGYKVGDLFNAVPGKLNWWHRTVGTQYNLAQRSPAFKRVYDAVQTFINDVSYFATEAADMAPNILPKLESWKDLAKSPLSAADTKALSAPVFEGTLIWARDESGKAVKLETLEAKAKTMTPEQKAQRLLRGDHISEQMLKTWKGLPIDQYERLVNDKYEDSMLKAGIVFKDAELTALFGLSDKQIALYREFRKATDKSLANLAIADMLRFGGKDADPVRDVVLESKSVKDAADTLSKYLRSLADLDPDRATVLMDTANKMIDKGDKAQGLMDRGYAPLSRFGSYTLDVVDANGERAYFGMFESAAEASRMRRKMEGLYPGSRITQGTVSEQAYKMFAGVSPETLELFGDMLGLETQGDDTASQAFQEYLKLAKSSRSAMKRLIQRKGIAGFSEDAGRVLAGFVYSNARQTATSLHMGEMTQAAADNDAFRNQGETQDVAVKLVDYIKNPQEEAQKLRGLLFAQYIGGSVASAMVNMTQPITMTFPWLSQYGGVASAAKQMTAAIKDVGKHSTGDTKLDAALRKAEEDGTVSPQEVHQLLKQSQGRSALQSDDGTRAGYAMALAQNTVSRFSLVWGKLFSVAEQFNRRVTFIAAYRTAVAQGMADPDEFARKAISETQGVYNKGNKPAWARGAVGSTLFTFKQYSIAYVEMLSRMAKSGPEGKKAALLALAVLFLLSGAGGMPGADDLDDVISGAMQAMGYNFDSKMKRKEFFVSLLGEGGAQFVERGVSGLPGVPIDVSGRMGLGNLIPGTGLLTKKADHTRDVAEIAGPAGDFVKRGFDAAGKLITGNVAGAVNSIVPKAIQNVTQAFDMANMGMYRDTKVMKVLDTDMGDAVVKAIGFQPNDVKRAQDANSEVARMSGLNKIIETEIANRWAIGIFEKDTDKVQAARDDLAEWNRSNPESPIRINFTQIRSRVQKMNQTKAERIAKTAPREIRAAVRKELADAR